MGSEAEYILLKVINLLNVKVNSKSLVTQLKAKPTFPSFASINETLNDFSIKTTPVELTTDELNEIDFPAISHFKNPENKFVILISIDRENQCITYYAYKDLLVTDKISAFAQKWSRIVLLVSKNEMSGEKYFLLNKLVYNLSTLILIFVIFDFIVGLLVLKQNVSDPIPVIFITKMVALIISWVLFIKESLPDSDILSKVCKINKVFDCEKILHSSGSRLFSVASLSEISVFYFTFTALEFFFNLDAIETTPILSFSVFLNILGLPIILYSLYYQLFKVKAFCLFCLSLCSLFIFEFLFGAFSLSFKHFYAFELFNSGLFLSLGLACLTLILMTQIKNVLVKKSLEITEQKKWFLNHAGVFRQLLVGSRTIHHGVPLNNKIESRADSDNVIVFVLNANCFHCKNIAYQINKNVMQTRVPINLTVIFFSEKEISMYLINIFLENGFDLFWTAYLLFISDGFEALRKKYSANRQSPLAESIYQEHMQWCSNMEITSTPKVFVDYHEIPENMYDGIELSSYIEKYFNE